MKEKLMYRGASKIPNRKSFRGNIKWFTTNKEYADSFAKYNMLYANGLDASMTYTVDIDTDNLKLYDCGVTDFPLYNIMRPMKPYQISTFMEEMVKGLRIDENTLKTLVNKVVDEYTNKGFTDREIFKLKLWNVVKTDTFASLVKSRGYDGVITNEFGNECYGIFDDKNIKILDEAIIIRDKRKLFEEVDDPLLDDPDDISTFEGPEVEEDDTYEDENLIKNEEILSTLYKYTHIKNKDSEDASYCFLEEICNIYGLDEDEMKDIALSNGYKLMKVFPNENVDGGLLIADKNCSAQHIKTDYLKFYGVEAEVEEYKGE